MTPVTFLSEDFLKQNTPISPNLNSKTIYFTIWTTQEEKILPALGTALYNRLILGIQQNDLKAEERTLLDLHVVPTLMFYTLAGLPTETTFKTTNKGKTTKGASAEGSSVVSMSDMAANIKHYTSKAEFRLEQMIKYLIQNASAGKFPEYLDPGQTVDTIRPQKRAYSCAIVLDDKDHRFIAGMPGNEIPII